jgi:hypothetical protein
VSEVLDFLRGAGRDPLGREIAELWAMTNEDLVASGVVVAWLFPIDLADPADPAHPVLDAAAWAAVRRDRAIRANLRRSLDRMLAFYGLAWDGERRAIRLGPDFREQAVVWLSPGNHNLLRLTRILRSLVLAGEIDAAGALFVCLEGLYRGPYRLAIGAQSFAHWAAALRPPGGAR